MKKYMLTILLSLYACVAFAADLPPGWYIIGVSPTGYDVAVAAGAGINGSGLIVKNVQELPDRFSGVGQQISAENYLGKKVRLSGFIRTKAVTDGYAGLWIRVDKEKEVLLLDNMGDRGVTGNTEWLAYDAVILVDKAATGIIFGALLTGKGEMFVDQLSLEIVSDDTPTTNSTSATFRKEPHSLDF
jgi:hypothetical protein